MKTDHTVSLGLDSFSLVDTLLSDLVMEKGFTHSVEVGYELVRDADVSNIGGLIFDEVTKNEHTILMQVQNALVKVFKRNSTVTVEALGMSSEECLLAIETFKLLNPPAPEPIDKEIRVKFWYLTKDGPASVSRTIAVPDWEDIKGNYSASTKEGLDDLINRFVPDGGGKIILWHGVPGTGKTYALRALVKKWKKWANISYILDPEALFGTSPGYLAQMIFSPEERYVVDEDDEESGTEEKWKILILEDTGELLSDNARERSGQGLSRLLNLADGFIGQGLRVLIIITTNEEIGKLHPAVAREGRCAASILFSELSSREAQLWAKENDAVIPEGGGNKNWTIADLFANKNIAKIDVAPKMEKVGFKALNPVRS